MIRSDQIRQIDRQKANVERDTSRDRTLIFIATIKITVRIGIELNVSTEFQNQC